MPTLIVLLLVAAHYMAFAQHQPVHIPPALQGVQAHGLDPSKSLDQYIHHVWNIENGLPQNSVWALCQTQDGYLWIGTQEGLVRYDGVRFTVFDKKNVSALTSNVITALIEDRSSSGALWIGTRGGGVSRLKDGEFISYTTKNGLSDNDVTTLLQDRSSDALWIGTTNGVNRLYKGTITHYRTNDGLSNEVITALLQDRDGVLWVGTQGTTSDEGKTFARKTSENTVPKNANPHDRTSGSIHRLENGVFTRYIYKGLPDKAVTALLQDRSGALWIGTTSGVNRLQNGILTRYTMQNGLSNNVIRTLLEDCDGALWIGTNGGVNRLRNNTISTYTAKKGLSNDVVMALLQDRDGSIWLGTHAGGVNRLQNGIMVSYTSKNGLSNDAVTAVMGDSRADSTKGKPTTTAAATTTNNKGVWIGTYGGGLNHFRNGVFTHYTMQSGLSDDVVRSLLQDRSGALWIGTIGGGVNRLKNGKMTTFTTKNGLSNDFVWSLVQDQSGVLWMGTEGGGLNRYSNGKFTAFTTQHGLSSDFVRVILEDRTTKNALWIGTYGGGLNYFQNGVFTHYTTQNGLSNNFIRSLLQDSSGALWIGTQGGGLNRFKDGKFTVFRTENGLFDDGAWCILEDDFGYLWMSCNKGIYRVAKADLNAFADGKLKYIPCKAFGVADGMKSVECNAGYPSGWKTPDGRLWFPTMVGALEVSLSNYSYTNPLAPPIIIESVKATDSDNESATVNIHAAATLAPEVQKFEFHYTATSLLAPEKVKFKYMLEGYDNAWVEAGVRRVAYYTNLPRGRQYRFRVIACNNDGVWNTVGASAMFYLTPYFWETWWFWGLSVLAFSLVVYQGFHWRINRLRKRAETLERLVDERTYEVLRQASEIQRTNTELQEKNIELHEANQFKTQMLSMASHDLKNPLSNMILLSQFLLKDLPENSTAKEYAGDILIVSRQMLNLVYDLLDTAARDMEKKQMDVHYESVNMYGLVTEIISYHAAQAEQKQQQIIVDCEADCWVDGDYKRLPQVIDNLLSNAIKYSPLGKRIWVSLEKSHDTVRFSVRDEGPGMSEEDRNKMFGFFQRLSARPTGGESSSGVGLAIVKQIVELHKGIIVVKSAVGEGTEFIVELPLKNVVEESVF